MWEQPLVATSGERKGQRKGQWLESRREQQSVAARALARARARAAQTATRWAQNLELLKEMLSVRNLERLKVVLLAQQSARLLVPLTARLSLAQSWDLQALESDQSREPVWEQPLVATSGERKELRLGLWLEPQ